MAGGVGNHAWEEVVQYYHSSSEEADDIQLHPQLRVDRVDDDVVNVKKVVVADEDDLQY